jgi:hypothetical protein
MMGWLVIPLTSVSHAPVPSAILIKDSAKICNLGSEIVAKIYTLQLIFRSLIIFFQTAKAKPKTYFFINLISHAFFKFIAK